VFDSERGLKQHITKAHTDKIDLGITTIRVLNPASFDLMGAMGLKDTSRTKRSKKSSKTKKAKKSEKKASKKTAKKKGGLFSLW